MGIGKKGSLDLYLFYNGKAREAFELYKRIFEAEKSSLMLFKDTPEVPEEFRDSELVMHASLAFDNAEIMLSDSPDAPVQSGSATAVNWSTFDHERARRVFAAFLDAGAKETMPLQKTFFADLYGGLVDPFGINWQILASSEEQPKQG